MKVKILVGRASPTHADNPGDIITVDDEEGRRLIERGRAELVPEKPEKATRSQREKRSSGNS